MAGDRSPENATNTFFFKALQQHKSAGLKAA
jgi:hypothetical protein